MVVANPELLRSEVVEGLANLAAKSLVAAEVDSRVARYRLLDTTRAYAVEKLDESGEGERIARRHAGYYRDVFERAEAEWETRPTAEWAADYGPHIDDVRAALDWGFSPDGNSSVAAALTAAAVPLWTHLSLMEECRGRVEQALAALGLATDRDPRREMKLHAALGASLVYSRSPTDPEIGAAWTKALEIAERLDDAEYRLRSLWGLWSFHLNSAQLRVALTLARRFCALAAKRPNANDRLVGERMMGVSLHFLGDQPSARRHLERMLAGYAAPTDRSQITRFQNDQRVAASIFLAWMLWLEGFPDRAIRAAESSVEAARAANHAISLCYALAHAACPITLFVGDLATAERYMKMLLDHSARHALALWHASSRSYQGMLVIKGGDVVTGLRLLREGFDELGGANTVFRFLTLLGEMAEALGRAGLIPMGSPRSMRRSSDVSVPKNIG